MFEILNTALAEGLIDLNEHTERLDAAAHLRFLREIVPLIEDLVHPSTDPPGSVVPVRPEIAALDDYEGQVPTTPEAIEEVAYDLYREDLRKAIMASAAPSVITVAIWFVTCLIASQFIFFWPAFVILGTGIGVVTTMTSKRANIQHKRRILTTRARAKLGDEAAQAEITANPAAFRYDPSVTRRARRNRRREIRRRWDF